MNCDFTSTSSEPWGNSEWWIWNTSQSASSYRAFREEAPIVTILDPSSGRLHWPQGANPTKVWVTYSLGEDQFGGREYGFVDQDWAVEIVGEIPADWVSWMAASYAHHADSSLSIYFNGNYIIYNKISSDGLVQGGGR